MKITCCPIEELTADQLATWSRLQSDSPMLDSPYFRPEFARAFATVQSGVEVAILDDRTTVGFWPFQRFARGVAGPIGGRMSDFHGVICRDDLAWSPVDLLRACALTVWDFDHLLAAQQPFRAFQRKTAPSPYMDFSGGFDAYRGSIHPQTAAQIQRKRRKLAREIGPLRLEAHTDDRGTFDTLIQWKRDKHGITRDEILVLEAIFAEQHALFSGMLTALYAGDQLAAVHFGMRSRHVLHCWYPAYNEQLQKYSPGLVLWFELAASASALGLKRVDMGKDKNGVGQYKTSLMSGSIEVAEGFVACRPTTRLIREGAYLAKEWTQAAKRRTRARKLRDMTLQWLGRLGLRASKAVSADNDDGDDPLARP